MIILRPTEQFDVVCLTDPALDEVPRDKMVEYGVRRDIALLDLGSLTQQATVFTCEPLRPEYEHLAQGDDMGAFEAWGLFSTHVKAIKPTPAEIKYVTRQSEKVIDHEAQKLIPPRVVAEVADVIKQRANADGVDVPFSVRDTSYQSEAIQRQALTAMRARMEETAKETNSS